LSASLTPRLDVALIHHPVVNRKGEVIASAVTNLDLHDIARAAMTYGVGGFYVATPLEDQRRIARRIIAHWTEGPGGELNPLRKMALKLIRMTGTLDEAVALSQDRSGAAPFVVATSAKTDRATIDFPGLRSRVWSGTPAMVVLGTAWGLADEAVDACDALLSPISGCTAYNHLSVRSAAAIILDRILGPENKPGR
jgi:tRNA (guanine37-N1)-methyltransferase